MKRPFVYIDPKNTYKPRDRGTSGRMTGMRWAHPSTVLILGCIVWGAQSRAAILRSADLETSLKRQGIRIHPTQIQSLSETTSNKVAAPWILEALLCWRAVANAAGISWVLARHASKHAHIA